jgi:hypothetical protein
MKHGSPDNNYSDDLTEYIEGSNWGSRWRSMKKGWILILPSVRFSISPIHHFTCCPKNVVSAVEAASFNSLGLVGSAAMQIGEKECIAMNKPNMMDMKIADFFICFLLL